MIISTNRWILYVLTLLLTSSGLICSAQSTYYVAANGNDANTGRTQDGPIRSLAKVNSLNLAPGDSVLFRRGDTFRGSLVISRSGSAGRPIVFDAYGRGTKPVLAGSVPVTNWVSTGTNIWQASCPSCGAEVTGLYRSGAALPLGRYPNTDASNRGYLTVQAHSGSTQITSQQPLVTDWTGGEVVVRPTYWIIDRALITRQSGNALTLSNTSSYTPIDGWGFFIQNHPATLDQPGEWCYTPGNKTIRIYDSGDPNRSSLTATTVSRGVDLNRASFISLRNLHITETLHESLLATTVANLTLTSLDVTNAGENAVNLVGTGRTVVMENCRISDVNNNGFEVEAYQGVTLRGNAIRRVGLLAGRGKGGDGQYNGLQSMASQALIENNIIDSIGYNGITFWNNTLIRQNTVSHFCMTKSDGGGLYVWNKLLLPMTNIRIESNIVHSGLGSPAGTSDGKASGAHGVFFDDCAQQIDMVNNTIFNCNGLGVYLHAVSNVRLIGNLCYNNDVSQLSLYNNGGLCDTRGNVFQQNIFLSTLPQQPYVAGFSSAANDLNLYGTFGQNYYARPFDDPFVIRAVYNQTIGDDLALPQWQSQFGHDYTSKISPITYKDYRVQRTDPTYRVNYDFERNGNGWEYWSPFGNGRAVWENSARLDNGSMRIDFQSPTGSRDSHILVYHNMQSVTKGKSYLLRFDAVASANRKVEVFLRQRNAPYQDLTRRYPILVGPGRKQYELAFTATADETSAQLTFQTREDGQTLWLDNVRLQDAVISPVTPELYVPFFYNPTAKDSVLNLPYRYRDVKNRYWGNRLVLKPFTSTVLLRDSLPPVDVRLSMRVDRTSFGINQTGLVSVRLQNESGSAGTPGNRVQWSCRLPASLTLVSANGLAYVDSVLTGTVRHLTSDTTFVFRVKGLRPGVYTLAAQVMAATYGDPDSTPDSGTDDREDDMAQVSFSVTESTDPDVELVTGLEPAGPPPAESVVVFPNPTTEGFLFQSGRAVQELRVVDVLGREWLRYGPVPRQQAFRFGERLPVGSYLIYIQYATGERHGIRLLKIER